MFDTMDAYDRADFDRLAEIYAEDAQWLIADPNGPHCANRDDSFAMFRQNKDYPSMEAAQAVLAGPSQEPAERWWRRWWGPGSRG